MDVKLMMMMMMMMMHVLLYSRVHLCVANSSIVYTFV